MFLFHNRLHFVLKETRPESRQPCSGLGKVSDRILAIGATIIGMFIIALFFVGTLISGFASQSAFVQACLHPNDEFVGDKEFAGWWIFTSVIVSTNLLAIMINASIYIWLKYEEEEIRMVMTEVTKIYGTLHFFRVSHRFIIIFIILVISNVMHLFWISNTLFILLDSDSGNRYNLLSHS